MEMKNTQLFRRKTRSVQIGKKRIGGDSPILVQTMTNTRTDDVKATLSQINQAALAGAEMIRVSVPDISAANALPELLEHSPIPVCADIHFDYKLALQSLRHGVHKLRINPGNIGSESRVLQICEEAQSRGIPIRIGVNAGSLEMDILEKYGAPSPEGLLESAMRNVAVLEKYGFEDIVVSLKASSVPMTIDAYRLISKEVDYPLHIGVTESGTLLTGAIRSAVGLGILLSEGIGDTVRVSLAADPVEEVRAAYRILESLSLRTRGPTVIACPTCSRTQIDIIGLAARIENILQDKTACLTVAVMGCGVNGPGEAREADLGIAGGKGEALLFKKGKIIKKIPENEIIDSLVQLFDEIAAEKN